jgi:hypothetical protein
LLGEPVNEFPATCGMENAQRLRLPQAARRKLAAASARP